MSKETKKAWREGVGWVYFSTNNTTNRTRGHVHSTRAGCWPAFLECCAGGCLQLEEDKKHTPSWYLSLRCKEVLSKHWSTWQNYSPEHQSPGKIQSSQPIRRKKEAQITSPMLQEITTFKQIAKCVFRRKKKSKEKIKQQHKHQNRRQRKKQVAFCISHGSEQLPGTINL